MRRLLDAYHAGELDVARDYVTEDITVRYVDHDGNPVIVAGIEPLARLAADPDRRHTNRERFRLAEVVAHGRGAVTIFEHDAPGAPARRQVAIWEFRGPRIRSVSVYLPVHREEEP